MSIGTVIRTEGIHEQRYVMWHKKQQAPVIIRDQSMDKWRDEYRRAADGRKPWAGGSVSKFRVYMKESLGLELDRTILAFLFGIMFDTKFDPLRKDELHPPDCKHPRTSQRWEINFVITSINSFMGRKSYIRSHPKQESNSKQQELPTRPQSPATSSLQVIQTPLTTTYESSRFTQKTYQLQRSVRTPPRIANIYEIQIPNKIMRNSHHIILPSLQRDQFGLQQETYCQSQEAVL